MVVALSVGTSSFRSRLASSCVFAAPAGLETRNFLAARLGVGVQLAQCGSMYSVVG
jgi:hypothetical protein